MEDEVDLAERFGGVLAEIAPLAVAFAASGRRLYLVGGIVRDGLLGRSRGGLDIDLTTDASPEEVEVIGRSLRPSAMWLQGQRFGTVGITLRTAGGVDRAVEITTHRSDEYEAGSRKPAVAFAGDVVADLARRDFTVNAMAIDAQMSVDALVVIDPFGGVADLRAGRLRTPSGPFPSFTDDPLRMLRAARFVAKYDFVAEAGLVAAAKALGDRLGIVSAERVRDEFSALIMLPAPARGLDFLADAGLLEIAVPGFVAMADDQLRAGLSVALAGCPADLAVRLAVVAVFCRSDIESVALQVSALKFPGVVIDDVTSLVRLHREFVVPSTDAALRRFVVACGDRLDRLLAVIARSGVGDGVGVADPATAAGTRSAVDALGQREDLSMRPVLDGADVMEHLGVGPGRAVGEALAMLATARLDDGPFDADEARSMLDAWMATRP